MYARLCSFSVAAVLAVGVAALLAGPADAARKRSVTKLRPTACSAGTFHPEVRVGGKCCFADGHSHFGSSSNQPTKAKAMQAAIGSWSSFTVWEYGGAYGSFSKASNKEMSCSGSGGSWYCSLNATPCR
jgi:hypothetical protein